jgi:hypothetical protein
MHTLRDALRSIRSTPILTAAALLSFALGIGANTAIFTLLDSLLLKPLPVRAPGELVALITPSSPNEAMPISYPVWKEIRDRLLLNRPFAWATDRLSLADTGEIAFVDAIWATGDYFDVLGIGAIRGRTFGPRDDRRDGGPDGPVAVLSFGAWQRQFGGAPDVVGRRLTIERVPFTIVGVTPPDFLGLNVGTTFGIAIGAAGSWWTSRLIASLLYGVAAQNLSTFAVSGLVMLGAAVAAAWRPARRAAQIDPAVVLREG